ncbi:MAG: immunoglobulin domain-containing protein [Verrucomicrobiales bacterium]|nr:immunoglobulin domain-containing protein [Verrucomicrobiales bacterium]
MLACSALSTSAAEMPQTAEDLANRVFLRTAPNGAIETFRLRAGGTFDAAGSAYKTNTFTYERAGLPANQAVLTLASRDVFSGKLSTRTNRFALTFETGDSGQYELQFLISTVPNPQLSSGPFEIAAGDNIAPRIWSDPDSVFVPEGASLGFSLGAVGYDLTYQWHRNGIPIPGATKVSYATNGMSAALEGDYYCVVANALGSATSRVARATVLHPPAIERAPLAVSVFEGGSAVFSVQAAGEQLRYEWTLNGVSLGSANTPTISLLRVTAAQAGFVAVTISNNAGSVTSDPVAMNVCAAALDSSFLGRPWIKILESRDPIPSSRSRFGPLAAPFNPIFTLWRKTLHAIARGDDNLANPPLLRNALVRWRDGELSTLVFTNVSRPDGIGFLYPFYPTDEGAGIVNFAERDAMFSWREGVVTTLVDTNTPAPGQSGVFYFGTGSFARRDGAVLLASTLVHADRSDAGTGLYLHDGVGLRRIADGTTDLPGDMSGYAFRATEDSVNLDGSTIVFSTTSGPGGKAGVFRSTYDGAVTKLLDTGDSLPGLTNRVVGFGDVDVEGDMVFAVVQIQVNTSIQGRVVGFERDGTAQVISSGDYLVAGGPRQVYFGNAGSVSRWTDGVSEPVINSAAVLGCRRLAGLFDVEAQGDDIAIGVLFADKSAGIYANFGAPEPDGTAPRILVQPQDITVSATTPATLSVMASGAADLRYQWRRDGVPLLDATNAVHTLLSATETELGAFDVVVSTGGGAVTSRQARVTLTDAPVIPVVFVQPLTAGIPIGSSTLLSVVAAGAPPLAYQWLLNTNPIAGATGRSLSVTPTSNTLYRVVISNAGGAVTSQVASVFPIPILTRQPQSLEVHPGGTATFSVEATGFERYRYFWFRDNNVIPGVTNATLTLSGVTEADAGSYSVTVFGEGGGTIRSAVAILRVTSSGGGGEPLPVTLLGAALEGGLLRFEFRSMVGTSYAVETSTASAGTSWVESARVAGDGATQVIRLNTAGAAGMVRVRSFKP